MADWLQSEVPFGQAKESAVQDALWQCTLADASSGTINTEMALFSRKEDYQRTVLLLSPAASKFAPLLPGVWLPSTDYGEYEWGVLSSNGATPADLGLKPISR